MAGLAYQFFMNIDKKFTLAYRCKLFWITFITLECIESEDPDKPSRMR